MDTLLNNVKVLAGIDESEDSYDNMVKLLIQSAIVRLKRAGITGFVLGKDRNEKIVTVGNFLVGQVNVGEIVGVDDSVSPYVLEYLAAQAKLGLYPDSTPSFYATLEEQSAELLTEMAYSDNIDTDEQGD